MSKRRDIQALRAIAVLLVLAYHAKWPLPGGYLGVDVFFVISGFVITGMLSRQLASLGTVSLKSFYQRRFNRLAPALAITITFTVLVAIFLSSPSGVQQTSFLTAIGATLLSSNFVIVKNSGGYFDAPTQLNPLLHTWSLSVEEQFYLVLPITLLILWRISSARSRQIKTFISIAVATLASFCVFLIGSVTQDSSLREALLGYYSPVTRAWEFGLGCLLSLGFSTKFKWAARSAPVLVYLGLGLIALCCLTDYFSSGWPNIGTILVCLGTALIILAGDFTNNDSRKTLLHWRPLVFVGDRSYSIYLWHFPIITFAAVLFPQNPWALLIGLGVTFIPALLSYRYIEKPIRLKDWVPGNTWLILFSTVTVVPLVISIFAYLGSTNSWGSEKVRIFQTGTTELHVTTINGCDKRQELPARNGCAWNRSLGNKTLFLLGDSNAGQFSDGAVRASEEIRLNLQISTTDACPFIDLEFLDARGIFDNHKCQTYVRKSMRHLLEIEPGIVVIANSNSYWSDNSFYVGANGTLTNLEFEKNRIFSAALYKTILRLRAHGHVVIIIQSIPKWDELSEWDPSTCKLMDVYLQNCVSRKSLISWNLEDQIYRREIIEAAGLANAVVWDFGEKICNYGICSTLLESGQIYRDSHHLSVMESNSLAGYIQKLLAKEENN